MSFDVVFSKMSETSNQQAQEGGTPDILTGNSPKLNSCIDPQNFSSSKNASSVKNVDPVVCA